MLIRCNSDADDGPIQFTAHPENYQSPTEKESGVNLEGTGDVAMESSSTRTIEHKVAGDGEAWQ